MMPSPGRSKSKDRQPGRFVPYGSPFMAVAEGYLAPQTLEEVARIATETGATILAGGTDLLPRWSKGLSQRPPLVIDLKRVEGLAGIRRANGEVHLGACTTLSEIAADATIRAAAAVLAEAAGRIACPQVRNRATIGGNLCNASPAADTAVPLLLLDAVLELVSLSGHTLTTREIQIADFFRGPGATALAPGEILRCIRFRPLAADTFAAWDKFGTRPAMEIAVASVGLALRVEDGAVTHARVGYGYDPARVDADVAALELAVDQRPDVRKRQLNARSRSQKPGNRQRRARGRGPFNKIPSVHPGLPISL